MKQSLTIKTGQQLAMTPALRQAIELLNLPSQQIEAKIQETLDSNIMLEEDESSTETEVSLTEVDEEKIDLDEDASGLVGEADDEEFVTGLEADRGASITDDILGSSENEVLFEDWLPGSLDRDRARQFEVSSGSSDFHSNRENGAEFSSLRQYLLDQLELVSASDEQKAISMVIIDALNEDGFLLVSLEEILVALKLGEHIASRDMKASECLTVTDIESNLKEIVQNFEPTGVGARSVQECLVLQLSTLDDATPLKNESLLCCDQFLDLFSKKDFGRLKNKLGLEEEDFALLVDLIRSLNPRPGAAYANHNAQYIIPDVYVVKMREGWQVESNSSLCPALRINSYYESLITKTQNDAESKTMQKHLAEAKSFMKSLRQRNETVLDVARAIVARQVDFFETGESAMKPMVLQDIADAVGRNASTISRATSGKYMDTPRGTFELKYFFDSHIRTEGGGTVSSVAIRNLIQKIIADENETTPHSDQKISNLLRELGFKVARRTVTKYREHLSIPPSSQRKHSVAS